MYREIFSRKIGDIKEIFHAKMGSIKDRNGMDLTEAEDIKKRWQEYTEELYKKDLHSPALILFFFAPKPKFKTTYFMKELAPHHRKKVTECTKLRASDTSSHKCSFPLCLSPGFHHPMFFLSLFLSYLPMEINVQGLCPGF